MRVAPQVPPPRVRLPVPPPRWRQQAQTWADLGTLCRERTPRQCLAPGLVLARCRQRCLELGQVQVQAQVQVVPTVGDPLAGPRMDWARLAVAMASILAV